MPRLADCLAALVAGLGEGLVREAIVVDGSSIDESAHLAADMGCKVVIVDADARGRGKQLQAGARAASGDWLLFLHADTVLQEGWVRSAAQHLSNAPQKAAYFSLKFDVSSHDARRVASLANLRALTLGLPYGDQGLLVSRALYNAVGGYGDLPLMEDVDLVRRIGKTRLMPLDAIALTSGVKFVRGGWWAVPARNLILLMSYLLGLKPATLAKWYR